MKKKSTSPGVIANRRARYDYELGQTYTAGIVLSGAETKSLRLGHGHLRGAYVLLKDDELWLVNATVTAVNANAAHLSESDQTRTRKLLIKRKEIKQLEDAKQQGLSLVPLRLLTGRRYIKLEFATGRGKKQYDKRDTLRKRDQERAAREV